MSFLDWMQAAALVAAGVAGIWYIARICYRAFKAAEAMYRLVVHELQPNSGSSLVDQVRKNADTNERLANMLETHLDWSANHARSVGQALQTIGHAVDVEIDELSVPVR